MSAGYMRACTGKKRFEDKTAALKARGSLAGDNGLSRDTFHVYKCIQCVGWHVGGAGNVMRSRRRRAGKRENKNRRGR